MAKVKCPFCGGEGIEPGLCHVSFPCPHCKGFGEIEVSEVQDSKAGDKAQSRGTARSPTRSHNPET